MNIQYIHSESAHMNFNLWNMLDAHVAFRVIYYRQCFGCHGDYKQSSNTQFTFICLISADVFVSDLVSREITSPVECTGEEDLTVTKKDLRFSLCNIICVFLSGLRFLHQLVFSRQSGRHRP